MTDIVTRLRSSGADGDAVYMWNLCTEAADEIERLRDCISAREVRSLVDERDRLRAERDDVRAELTNLQIAFNDWKVAHSTMRLQAEIERMRYLLEKTAEAERLRTSTYRQDSGRYG